jgi:chromate transporter
LAADEGKGPVLPVFIAALQLGCSAFGGPIAHLGFFRRSFVEQRRWIDADTFASIIALCQMLPGPTSSQGGFLIGWHRAGWRGAIAAWLGFTLPSALLMYLFAIAAPHLHGALPQAALHGLKIAAVAIVAQAVWSMARSLRTDAARIIAALTAIGMLLSHGARWQLLALVLAAAAGVLLLRETPVTASRAIEVRRGFAVCAFALFVALTAAAIAAGVLEWRGLAGFLAIICRSGALVFGGGHVVLPLLRESLVPGGWISDDAFLAGYGAAQALPGPLFAFAAFLGAAAAPAGASLSWAIAAVLAIFLPGLLIAIAGLSLWRMGTQLPRAGGALAGLNAAVVGILGAALYNPVVTTSIHGAADAIIALAGFWLLQKWRMATLPVVALCVAGAALLS